ncbi:MAG TPA: NADH-quinone oxidoreductase subunit C [Methyloceanibacter sp.]|jgi:Ni,Fe-hydrogenase III large subunit|nr:NADH-quinone oxidoreductase subunit C [Methyloceanibacter sp.]
MAPLTDIAEGGRKVKAHHPWSRSVITSDGWRRAIDELAQARAALLGLWGDKGAVHLALIEELSTEIAIFTLECPDGKFPSVGAVHPPAIRLERAIRDLFGLKPVGASDTRPWLDLDFWGVTQPLGAAKKSRKPQEAYAFLPVEGEDLHQIPVGPVHAGIIEPGHFRFTASGETVVRLEERLGYVHKGTESLMMGASIERGAQLAGRMSGDSTVAYAFAYAQAVEAALQVEVPESAVYLRALMAELERLANHFGDIGAICNDASFAILLADFGILRERVLRTADACFGHRLMMDRIVPGGVAQDIALEGFAQIPVLIETVRRRFPELIEVYDNTASLQDRTVTTGYLSPTYARAFGAGGYVGRASGRAFDARKAVGYAPYDRLEFEVPVRDDGDVNARVWIRIREVEQSLRLIEQIAARLPEGPMRVELPITGDVREGIGLVESFRGDVLVYVRIGANGRLERCHLRDPSWFQWPLLEACVEGNIVADFPLCNKSFNCSYSGHDL